MNYREFMALRSYAISLCSPKELTYDRITDRVYHDSHYIERDSEAFDESVPFVEFQPDYEILDDASVAKAYFIYNYFDVTYKLADANTMRVGEQAILVHKYIEDDCIEVEITTEQFSGTLVFSCELSICIAIRQSGSLDDLYQLVRSLTVDYEMCTVSDFYLLENYIMHDASNNNGTVYTLKVDRELIVLHSDKRVIECDTDKLELTSALTVASSMCEDSTLSVVLKRLKSSYQRVTDSCLPMQFIFRWIDSEGYVTGKFKRLDDEKITVVLEKLRGVTVGTTSIVSGFLEVVDKTNADKGSIGNYRCFMHLESGRTYMWAACQPDMFNCLCVPLGKQIKGTVPTKIMTALIAYAVASSTVKGRTFSAVTPYGKYEVSFSGNDIILYVDGMLAMSCSIAFDDYKYVSTSIIRLLTLFVYINGKVKPAQNMTPNPVEIISSSRYPFCNITLGTVGTNGSKEFVFVDIPHAWICVVKYGNTSFKDYALRVAEEQATPKDHSDTTFHDYFFKVGITLSDVDAVLTEYSRVIDRCGSYNVDIVRTFVKDNLM